MKRILSIAFVAIVTSATNATDVPSTDACTYKSPGHVVYKGATGNALGECLDGAGAATIDELTITSHGGDAWATLQVALRYRNRIDRVVVAQWCNSSCANYVAPIAKHLIVQPSSYLVVHGSIDPSLVRKSIDSQRAALVREHPEVPAAGWDAALAKSLSDVRAERLVQDGFEKDLISCPEWLHPDEFVTDAIAHGRLPKAASDGTGLVVTQAMAKRCLRSTQIEDSWFPRTQADLPAYMTNKGAVVAP